MNYLDYTDDNGMNMFTIGQKQRMWAALMTTFRDSLFLSQACIPIDDGSVPDEVRIIPNPSDGKFLISFTFPEATDIQFSMYDLLGKIILQKSLNAIQIHYESIDLTKYSHGLYLLKIKTGDKSIRKKICIQ